MTFIFYTDNEQCDSHIINAGLIHTPGSSVATLEFEGTGPNPTTPITMFSCTVVNNMGGDVDLSPPEPCKFLFSDQPVPKALKTNVLNTEVSLL